MTLEVDVLGTFPLTTVRATIARLATGAQWTLTATAGAESWTVARGLATGTDVTVVADPWAPLGREVSYTLDYDGGSGERLSRTAGPVTRTHRGWDVITDLAGSVAADFIRPHADPREYTPRGTFFDLPGQPAAPGWYAPTAGRPAGQFTARTTGSATRTLHDLVMANRPVVVLHNHARCPMPGCTVPSAETVFLTGASNDLAGRKSQEDRLWSLSFRPVPVPFGFLPPVVTVGDVARAFPTVGDLTNTGMTMTQLLGGDWFVSGLLPTMRRGEWSRGGGGDLARAGEGEWADGPAGTLVPTAEPGLYQIEGAP